MLIRKLEQKDVTEIAGIHVKEIPSGFLSSLGISFLKLIYQSMVRSEDSFCIVAEENGRIIGFVSGTIGIGKFYKEFFKKNFIKAGMILFLKALNPQFAKKIFETLFYPARKEQTKLPNAELMSIVVDKKYQGKGVSKDLFKRLVQEFKKRGIDKFKVTVGSNLVAACKFYEKMGGILHLEIEVHKGEKSRVYVWNI